MIIAGGGAFSSLLGLEVWDEYSTVSKVTFGFSSCSTMFVSKADEILR